MRSIYISMVLFINAVMLFGQDAKQPCLFDEYTNNKSIQKAEIIIQKGVADLKNKNLRASGHDSLTIIPVVIHVIHEGGPENISDAQIQSQIQIMNEDYGKLPGTNGDGAGVDTKVRFKLAQIDPNGNCTSGIVRVYSSLTTHNSYQRAMLKELSFWDNTKYMNIYLVKSISGSVLGYSSFPGGPADEDGMVVRSDVFGNMGTANGKLGRTASHEIGHWFGLYHTFNNGCGTDLCTDGDYVCDTPPQDAPSFDCSDINSCSNDFPDVNDQKENYLNYTNDACKNMFTNGQKLRIHSTLNSIRTLIWSESNLVATGTDSNYVAPAVCAVVANFVTLTDTVCKNGAVNFSDISLNGITSWNWTFPGGNPASSTDQNPTVVYDNPGTFSVKLVVSNGTTSDSLEKVNYINTITPGTGRPIPFYEDFEATVFPAQGIKIINNDGGITWEKDSISKVTGGHSIRINNLINTNYGSADDIVLPFLDFTAFTGSRLFMTFDYAYARSDASFSDDLVILLSQDCGVNFKQVIKLSGGNLTTAPTQTTPFIPDTTQWKEAKIYLEPYRNLGYVQVKLVNVTDGGNNLYLDNINIGDFPVSVTSIPENNDFVVYPNPASNEVVLEFSRTFETRWVTIYNTVGKQVFLKEIRNTDYIKIPTQTFSNGVYVVEIKTGNRIVNQKLIISK